MQVSRKNYESMTATQPSRAQQNMQKIQDKMKDSINSMMFKESEITRGTVVKPLDTDRKAQSMMTNYPDKDTKAETFGKNSEVEVGKKSDIKLMAGTMDMKSIDVGITQQVNLVDSEL